MNDTNKRRIYDANSGPGTLISEGCKIKGAITGRGNYMINGEVDGECDIEGTVTVAQNGFWRGTIRAHSIIVTGTIEGDIYASGGVEIGDTARVSGTVSGESIAVAEGAVVEGVMQTTSQEEPTAFVEKRHAEEADNLE
jgi:cytoskeletal protein CcmA (bactofilin family)